MRPAPVRPALHRGEPLPGRPASGAKGPPRRPRSLSSRPEANDLVESTIAVASTPPGTAAGPAVLRPYGGGRDDPRPREGPFSLVAVRRAFVTYPGDRAAQTGAGAYRSRNWPNAGIRGQMVVVHVGVAAKVCVKLTVPVSA